MLLEETYISQIFTDFVRKTVTRSHICNTHEHFEIRKIFKNHLNILRDKMYAQSLIFKRQNYNRIKEIIFRNSEAKVSALFDVRPRNIVSSYQRFGGTCCLSIWRVEEDMITIVTNYHFNDTRLHCAFGRLQIMGEILEE